MEFLLGVQWFVLLYNLTADISSALQAAAGLVPFLIFNFKCNSAY